MERRSLTGRKHHQAHDALAIHFFAFFAHPDFGAISAGDTNKHRGRTRVQSEPVDDRHVFFDMMMRRRITRAATKQAHLSIVAPLN